MVWLRSWMMRRLRGLILGWMWGGRLLRGCRRFSCGRVVCFRVGGGEADGRPGRGGDILSSSTCQIYWEDLKTEGYNRSMLNPTEIRPLLKQWITRVMPHDAQDVFIEELCFID